MVTHAHRGLCEGSVDRLRSVSLTAVRNIRVIHMMLLANAKAYRENKVRLERLHGSGTEFLSYKSYTDQVCHLVSASRSRRTVSSRNIQSSGRHFRKMYTAEYKRGIKKQRANTGKTTETIIRRYPVHSPCSKSGVTPSGAGAAPTTAPSAEFMMMDVAELESRTHSTPHQRPKRKHTHLNGREEATAEVLSRRREALPCPAQGPQNEQGVVCPTQYRHS